MHICNTSLGRAYEKNRGRAIAIGQIGLPIGESLFSLLIVFLLALFGWRQSLLIIGFSVIFLALPLEVWLASHEPDSQHDKAHNKPHISNRSRRQVLADWRFYAIMMFYIGSPAGLTALFLNQAILATERGWSLTLLASAFGSYAVVKIIVALYIGTQIDRYNARLTLPLAAIPLVLAFAFLLLMGGGLPTNLPADNLTIASLPLTPFIYMALVGAHVGILSSSIASLWPELYGTVHLGGIRSLAATGATFGTACGPVIAGIMLDWGWGYDGLVWAVLFYTLVSLPIVIFALRHYR